MNQCLDPRILEYLAKKDIKTNEQIKSFLNLSLNNLLDPYDLDGMKEAVSRIQKAINEKQKVVIYGDYDCDGISACVILYKYFLSQGIKADVYIPNRFDDGYGLSFDMIYDIKSNSDPDLIITVDLGITAVKEVEKIKELGIDIIVTDHHEPAEILPNTIIIDPKKPGQKYAFNGLCGAGVALKLVQALSGIEEVEKYLDIAGVATIGDIVPLVSENRIIAKLGLEKLAKKEGLKSLVYMINKLGISEVSGTDVAFRIVPRLNASGRMSQGKKVFDFLVEQNDKKIEILYSNILDDNEARLKSISEGAISLEKQMEKVDLSKENIILLKGDFHQGVLGILASRICHDYNRPAIIFTKTEEGTLKGSGRSLESVDLHQLLMQSGDFLVRFGGHKMAVGVELEEDKFELFKAKISELLAKQVSSKNFITREEFDIEIEEKDINQNFISELKMLEPFGCQNEKPLLMMKAKRLTVSQMKENAFHHFKVSTQAGKNIMCFNGKDNVETLRSGVKKDLIVELENNTFRGKTSAQAVLKQLYLKEIKLDQNQEKEFMLSLLNCYQSQNCKDAKTFGYNIYNLEDLLKEKDKSLFGTVVVIDSPKIAEKVASIFPKLKNYTISHVALKSKQNTLLVSRDALLSPENLKGYKNIIFTRIVFSHEKDFFAKDFNVYVPYERQSQEYLLASDREVNIRAYNLIRKYARNIKANNLFEWLEKIQSVEGGLSKPQLLFSMLSFEELGFVQIVYAPDFVVNVNQNPPKRDLGSSKFMNRLSQRR